MALWFCWSEGGQESRQVVCSSWYSFRNALTYILGSVVAQRRSGRHQMIHPGASFAVGITRSLLTFCGEFQVMARNKLSLHVWEQNFLQIKEMSVSVTPRQWETSRQIQWQLLRFFLASFNDQQPCRRKGSPAGWIEASDWTPSAAKHPSKSCIKSVVKEQNPHLDVCTLHGKLKRWRMLSMSWAAAQQGTCEADSWLIPSGPCNGGK